MAAQRRAAVAVAPMRSEDIDELMEIERASYRSPWARQVFLDELHRSWARVDVLREVEGGPLRAFANYWIVGEEVHLLNVAVHPAARRRGHARRLLAHLVDVARASGCRFLTLEVRRGNHGAIRLYRREGYRPVGIRPRYYDDGEDAIVMILELS